MSSIQRDRLDVTSAYGCRPVSDTLVEEVRHRMDRAASGNTCRELGELHYVDPSGTLRTCASESPLPAGREHRPFSSRTAGRGVLVPFGEKPRLLRRGRAQATTQAPVALFRHRTQPHSARTKVIPKIAKMLSVATDRTSIDFSGRAGSTGRS